MLLPESRYPGKPSAAGSSLMQTFLNPEGKVYRTKAAVASVLGIQDTRKRKTAQLASVASAAAGRSTVPGEADGPAAASASGNRSKEPPRKRRRAQPGRPAGMSQRDRHEGVSAAWNCPHQRCL